MKVTEYILKEIKKKPKGYVFTYIDFSIDNISTEAIIKALNRMVFKGSMAKLSKGKFYKPENTIYGDLQPNQYQVVKDLMVNNSTVIGYLTGLSIYNKLGLTTQISNTIQIGSNTVRPAFSRGRFQISYIRQKNTITKYNIPLLQILDSIHYIKKIPDTDIQISCVRFVSIIKDMSQKNKKTMVELVEKYPPSTRALMGAILEESGNQELTKILKRTLNPITKYRLTGACKVLSSAEKWNIV